MKGKLRNSLRQAKGGQRGNKVRQKRKKKERGKQ